MLIAVPKMRRVKKGFKLCAAMFLIALSLVQFFDIKADAKQFSINYREAAENGDYVAYLSGALSGISQDALTDGDLEDITNYIEYVIRLKGSIFIDGSSGVVVEPGITGYGINLCTETKRAFEEILSERNITLNREIFSDLMVFCEKTSINNGISLIVPAESMRAIPENTNLRIILKRMDVSIALRSSTLTAFSSSGVPFGAYIKRDANEDKYKIEFKNQKQETVERIAAPVRV